MLGIDQSLTNLGVVALSGVAPPEYSNFHFVTKKMGSQRLLTEIPDMISPLLDSKPDLLVIEGGSYCAPGALYSLGELSGILRYMAYQRGIQSLVPSPNTVKAFATGYGLSTKIEMCLRIQVEFGFQIPNEHVADAFWMAMVGAAYLEVPGFPWNDSRTKAINRLRGFENGVKTREKSKAKRRSKTKRLDGGSF